MSTSYKSVKRYYDKGIYTKEDLVYFITANMITTDEYKLITGDDYVA